MTTATFLLLDPATVALHEVAEPGRLRTLIRQLRETRVQDTPVLVTDEPGGLLVLDGVHRTKALLSLGVPRMLAFHVPRQHLAEPGSWTHLLSGPQDVLARLRVAPDVTTGSGPGAPVVAHLVARGERTAVGPAGRGLAALSAAFHAVADTYAGLPYRRVADPGPPPEGELQVRWQAPSLREVEELVARHGALPAGITRFGGPVPVPRRPVALDDLSAATAAGHAEDLLRRVRDDG